MSPSPSASRISARFAALRQRGRNGFVSFIMAGDPDLETSFAIMSGLPKAGADVIELGMPFTDPMADGPAIQEAGQRAIKAGANLRGVLDMARRFRATDNDTPIVLMGYYNPIFHYGREDFLRDAKAAGVDGLIVVDLPPEEDAELCEPARKSGLDFIRLVTPTTSPERLKVVLRNAGGFLYYVSVTGITGNKRAEAEKVEKALAELKKASTLPIAVGFGITSPEQVKAFEGMTDAVVVGSAIVKRLSETLDEKSRPTSKTVAETLNFVKNLSGK